MTSVEPSRRAALSTGACDRVSHRRVMSCPEATVGRCDHLTTETGWLRSIQSRMVASLAARTADLIAAGHMLGIEPDDRQLRGFCYSL